jgi:hypothetical protein
MTHDHPSGHVVAYHKRPVESALKSAINPADGANLCQQQRRLLLTCTPAETIL